MRVSRSMLGLWGFATLFAVALPHSGECKDPRSIRPPDVFLVVTEFQAELELLRLEMGARPYLSYGFTVADATPREVFFQAVALLDKAKRLSLEQIGERGEPLLIAQHKDYAPSDVHAVMNAALARLQAIKTSYDIVGDVETPERDASKTPTEVYNAILASGRQLRMMLDTTLAPRDVYEQVSIASSFAEAILRTYPGATSPKQPALERRKRPQDVYERLVECFRVVERIAKSAGAHTLQIRFENVDRATIVPGDVYELATLLVSELAYLENIVGGTDYRYRGLFSDRQWPSDVFQNAGHLELQLKEIEKQNEAHPKLLRERVAQSGR